MDPLSFTASVVGITATCLQTAKALSDLRSRMSYAELTITAMCTETTIISASLSQIQSMLLNGPAKVFDRPDLRSTLDQTLTGCYLVFDVLQKEVLKFTGLIQPGFLPSSASSAIIAGTNGAGSYMGLADKLRLTWNENTMQEILSQMRGLQTALALLLQLFGIDQMASLATTMENNTTILAKIAEKTAQFGRTRSISGAPESIFDISFSTQSIHTKDRTSIFSETAFRFDDAVVNAQIYRRVLAKAYRTGSGQNDNLIPDELRDEKALASIHEHDRAGIDDEDDDDSRFSFRTALEPDNAAAHTANGLPTLKPFKKEGVVEFLTGPHPGMLRSWDEANNIRLNGEVSHSSAEIQYQRMQWEILGTEVQFLHDLQTLRFFYKERLNLDPTIVTTTFDKTKFPGARAIYHVNKTLLLDPLVLRHDSEDPSFSHCWDIFENWLAQSEKFYLAFAKGIAYSRQFVGEEVCVNPRFVKFLKESAQQSQKASATGEKQSRREHWDTYTEAPMRHLRRYIILLRNIEKTMEYDNVLCKGRQPVLLAQVIKRLRALCQACDNVTRAEVSKVRGAFLRSLLASETQAAIPRDASVVVERTVLYRESRLRSTNGVSMIILEQPDRRVVVLRQESLTLTSPVMERKPLFPLFVFEGQIKALLSSRRVGGASENDGADVYTISLSSARITSSRANTGAVIDFRTTERGVVDRLGAALTHIGADVQLDLAVR